MYIYVLAYVHTNIHICMCAFVHIYTDRYIYTYICACIYTYKLCIHTRIGCDGRVSDNSAFVRIYIARTYTCVCICQTAAVSATKSNVARLIVVGKSFSHLHSKQTQNPHTCTRTHTHRSSEENLRRAFHLRRFCRRKIRRGKQSTTK